MKKLPQFVRTVQNARHRYGDGLILGIRRLLPRWVPR